MKDLSISALQIKDILFTNHKTMNATYKLTSKYKKKLREQGFNSMDSRLLPRDWFLREIQKEFGFSDDEVNIIKEKLDESP